jgi:hypothetical protein
LDYVSLSGFKKLTQLYCEFDFLLPSEDNSDVDDDMSDEDIWPDESALGYHCDIPKTGRPKRKAPSRLSKQLPPSLEALTIKGSPIEKWPWSWLARMLEEREVYLPNLKQIWFQARRNPKWDVLRDILVRKGIEYKALPHLLDDPLLGLLDGQGGG